MPSQKKKKKTEIVVNMPVVGMPTEVAAELKKRFKNDVVAVLGKEKLAGRDIVITMIPADPIPWFTLKPEA
jgi:hypothetical protein